MTFVRSPIEGHLVFDPLLSEAMAVRTFRIVRRAYYAMLGTPLVALAASQAMLATSPNFEGYAPVTSFSANVLTALTYTLGLTGLVAVLFLRRWCFQPHRFGLTGDLSTEQAVHRLMVYQFLVFACAVSPAFLGLLEFVVAGLRPGTLDLLALGVLALVLARPRGEQWTATLAQLARLWPDVLPVVIK